MKSPLTIALLPLALSAFGMLAVAADFPERKASELRSAKEGLGRAEVKLLRREPGPGKDAVVAKLLQHFQSSTNPVKTSGKYEKVTDDGRVLVRGEGWALEVRGDGTRVRYRNYGHLEGDVASKGKPVEQRMSQKELESRARRFVEKELSGLIKLGRGETLEPQKTEFMLSRGGSTAEGGPQDPTKVHAGTMVYSRSLERLPVIGAGSKTAVLMDNEGMVFGFDYDWPEYAPTGKTQVVVDPQQVRSRAEKLTGLDLKAANVQVSRFECGYFDAGLERRAPEAPVQAGCSMHVKQKPVVDPAAHSKDAESGHTTIATVHVIPAGVRVERDERWPEAAGFRGDPPRQRARDVPPAQRGAAPGK